LKTPFIEYQNTRIKEGKGAKTINEEVGFLLRLLEDQGDVSRADETEEEAEAESWPIASESFYGRREDGDDSGGKAPGDTPQREQARLSGFVHCLRCGLRDKESRRLRWMDVDLIRRTVTVGQQSKTDASAGRILPMKEEVFEALKEPRWLVPVPIRRDPPDMVPICLWKAATQEPAQLQNGVDEH
jgi:hypothetical protein